MDLYKELAGMRCFTREDLVKLTGSKSAAAWYISSYLKKGYIERIKHDLYAVISLETSLPIPTRYQIASNVADDSYVSHHSAFEYYGYANQVFYDMYVSTEKRVQPFSYDGINYHIVVSKGRGGVTQPGNGVRVTSLERTVIDSIEDFEKIGGLEELLHCISMIPSLSSDKLLESLDMYGYSRLYQKTGYLLENFRNELDIPESFFEECEKHISGSKAYFSEDRKDFVFYKRWKLYAPKNLRAIIDQGGM